MESPSSPPPTTDQDPSPEASARSATRARRTRVSANDDSSNFQIDPEHHARPLSSLPFSTRARNILVANLVKTLGDLHNTPVSRIRDAHNCGFKSASEIFRVLSPYFAKDAILKTSRSDASAHKPLSVPEAVRDWPLKQLPISLRLDHVLTRLKMEKLGDLHGMDLSVLRATPDCGVRTAAEIRELLGRIQRGEFGKSREAAGMSPCLYLVTRIDDYVDRLSEPRQEILCRRLGATDAPWTLMRIGEKIKLTRERVRQIVNLLAGEALRFGGPPMVATLNEMADELLAKVMPLTPALLKERLGPVAAKRRHGLAFYARLIEMISPRMPVWAEGPEPAAHRARESEAILQTLAHWVRVHPAPTPFAAVLTGLREENGFACTSAALLQAIKHAVGFETDFSDPENPTLTGGRRAWRRWGSGQESDAEAPPFPKKDVFA